MQRHEFFEIFDDRHGQRATLLASQLLHDACHERIGDPTKVDSNLDRLLHGAQVFELRGESLRKAQGRAEQTVRIRSITRHSTDRRRTAASTCRTDWTAPES